MNRGEATADLIARVRAATGPDREIDVRIDAASGEGRKITPTISDAQIAGLIEIWPEPAEGFSSSSRSYADDFGVPLYTASIDAALALVERVRPGWSIQIYRHPDATYVNLYQLGELTRFPLGDVERRVTSPYFDAQRLIDASVPLAILEALLLSLSP